MDADDFLTQIVNIYECNALYKQKRPRLIDRSGTNGIGKSTALKILAGKMKPNLGRYDGPPDWEEILVSSMSFDWKRNVFTLVYAVKELRSDVLLKSPQIHFRGSDLQNYFTKILEDDIKATIKPQYVDHIPRAVRGLVGDILKKKDERTEHRSAAKGTAGQVSEQQHISYGILVMAY